ncbi:hypothetical protein [Paractinoplanes brasiliensis]|uniref:Uncharacterized protein n=1 Tax=Paractinoplanes brasiliensis TaxID=52695 RepID=A0A4R6JP53_9ACTN|nr:hypothetical protein [Actinoplanes brasiliensis]TDO38234.1 hypothetical protein C8E87_1884 [Actinoplanes brasiliensis]GID26989.1 hypothetical protein Abr02nite_19720 [Actinoplanes brasiliensis]
MTSFGLGSTLHGQQCVSTAWAGADPSEQSSPGAGIPTRPYEAAVAAERNRGERRYAGAVASGLLSPGLARLFGPTELDRLYGMVLAFPLTAYRVLTADRVPDPVLRHTLRAETAMRLDRPRKAMTLAGTAVATAARQKVEDPAPLLAAATVLGDAAVVAGAPDAVDSCADLIRLAQGFGDQPRTIIGGFLHAVAVYQQHSCRDAAGMLDRIFGLQQSAALAAARRTFEDCCARRNQTHLPGRQRLLVTAGGLIQPALTPMFTIDRLLRWPGIHTCSSSAAGGRQ